MNLSKKQKKLFSIFIKNFLIAGFLIGIYSLIMELTSPELVGFIHGSLPITFTYIIFLTLIKEPKKVKDATYVTGMSGLLWLLFVFTLYILLHFGLSLPISYAITFVIFILMCIVFYYKFYKYLKK